jgi:hypothetical protein
MPSKKSNKSKKYRKKNKTCKIYRSCDHVPCQEAMIGCRPKYCSKGSKSWKSCNMANWKPHETGGVSFEHLRERCTKEYAPTSNCRMSKRTKISTDQVDALELHNKMPYIWRFLDNKTRRKMVRLARKPVSEINIQ